MQQKIIKNANLNGEAWKLTKSNHLMALSICSESMVKVKGKTSPLTYQKRKKCAITVRKCEF